jgi:ABC-2 type transport system permease protein
MNTPSIETPDSTPATAPAVLSPTRPMYWSIRREVWENRSIYIAPLVVAVFVLFGSCFSVMTLPGRMQKLPANDPGKVHTTVVRPFSFAPAPIIFVTLIVGIFYSLDALYGERRDRSILFWKSLPVSDRTAVLSKVSIPLIVLPLVGFVLGQITQITLLLFSTVVMPASSRRRLHCSTAA